MQRFRPYKLAIPALVLAAACPFGAAQTTARTTARDTTGSALPAMSEKEEEAVFASAVNAERRYRDRVSRLRRLRHLARKDGDQRRVHELEQLMDYNQRRHTHRIKGLNDLLKNEQRWDLTEAVSDGRNDVVDWAPRQPSVWDATARRQVRGELRQSHRDLRTAKQVDTRRDRRSARREAEPARHTTKRSARRERVAPPRNPRLERLRPELRTHLTRLKHQDQVDAATQQKITAATAEAEYQLLRQEIERERR